MAPAESVVLERRTDDEVGVYPTDPPFLPMMWDTSVEAGERENLCSAANLLHSRIPIWSDFFPDVWATADGGGGAARLQLRPGCRRALAPPLLASAVSRRDGLVNVGPTDLKRPPPPPSASSGIPDKDNEHQQMVLSHHLQSPPRRR